MSQVCGYKEVINLMVFKIFMKVLEEYLEHKISRKVWRRIKRAIAGAAADGPLPIGDIIAIIEAGIGVAECVVWIFELNRHYNQLAKLIPEFAEKIIEDEIGGVDVLKDPCKC